MKLVATAVLLGFVVVLSAGCSDSSFPTAPSLSPSGSPGNTISVAKSAVADLKSSGIPTKINGVELTTIRGWFANIYPWPFTPETSTVYPVPWLWPSGGYQTVSNIVEQNRQLESYGSGADILTINPREFLQNDVDFYNRTYLNNGSRPFFILTDGPISNASGPYEINVADFKQTIDLLFKNVIIPHQSRYVTVNGKAVIYLWASDNLRGLAGAIEEVKKEYPVFFLGGDHLPNNAEDQSRIRALDGIMLYTLGGTANYMKAIQDYYGFSFAMRRVIRQVQSETGKKLLFIPIFQAAYDSTKVPGRTAPPMYPRTKEEMEYHAQLVRDSMWSLYDGIGPFVIYSEMPEGGAVIESQCLPETVDQPGRYVGCGTGRLEVLKKFFGK